MGKFIDLTGQKFGRLTVISRAENNKHKQAMWRCRCECSNEKNIRSSALISGHTESCGCLTRQALKAATTKHGLAKTRLYHIWKDMKKRCYNPNCKAYKNYGGRGIKICDEWLGKENGFMNFYNWSMANGYNDTLSIDRKDNDKGYSPDNCRWVSMQAQIDNRRCSKTFTYEGIEYKSLAEASRQLGISKPTLYKRSKKENGD